MRDGRDFTKQTENEEILSGDDHRKFEGIDVVGISPRRKMDMKKDRFAYSRNPQKITHSIRTYCRKENTKERRQEGLCSWRERE